MTNLNKKEKNENIIIEEAEYEEHDFSIKIIILGDSGVGKSKILSRFVYNEFSSDSKSTLGVEVLIKKYKINGKVIKFTLWDTAGQERFKSICAGYFRRAKGVMVVYDITNKESFDNVDKWLNQIKQLGEKDISILMCGNKSDLVQSRRISVDEGIEKGVINNICCMETSALDSSNVEEAFRKLIIEIYKTSIKNDEEFQEEKLIKNEIIEKKKNKCC